MIEARNLWKKYGDKVVLEGINLRVEEGEFVTLVGTSGCGKSTLQEHLSENVAGHRAPDQWRAAAGRKAGSG